jgi:phage FluMu protein Com
MGLLEVGALAARSDRYGAGMTEDPAMTAEPHIASTRFHVTKRPVVITDNEIRCQGQVTLANGSTKTCNKLLATRASRPWEIVCPRCRHSNVNPQPEQLEEPELPVAEPEPSARER